MDKRNNNHLRTRIYYATPWCILLCTICASQIRDVYQDDKLNARGKWMQEMQDFSIDIRADRWTKKNHEEWLAKFCAANNLKPIEYKPTQERLRKLPTLPVEK